jgi:hypothetical protein
VALSFGNGRISKGKCGNGRISKGKCNSTDFGHAGREHLTQSLIDLSIDMSSDFFALAHLSFTE